MEERKKCKIKLVVKGLLEYAGIMALGVFCVIFIAGTATVYGSSMEGSYSEGDRLLVWKLGYTPRAGDVVILNDPEDDEKKLIKRVIATGGQTVIIDGENGKVLVDGKELFEPYTRNGLELSSREDGRRITWELSQDEIFVMGDNREYSKDSRMFGPLPCENVKGKVTFRLWKKQ